MKSLNRISRVDEVDKSDLRLYKCEASKSGVVRMGPYSM
jgi:hypothetical protein